MADAGFARASCTLRQLLDLALLCRRHGDPLNALGEADTLPPRARTIAHPALALTRLLGTTFAIADEGAELVAARANIRTGIERPSTPHRVALVAYPHRHRTEACMTLTPHERTTGTGVIS